MALASVQLDDLAWDDLVSAARQRIPAVSGGKWTLHAPVDPGITLVELYAWLLEQRLYWMDQVPDPALRRMLALFGEEPAAARASGTALALTDASSPRVLNRQAPMGLELSVIDADPALWFTTTSGATVLEVAAVSLWAGGVDRTADLEALKPVQVLAASPSELKVVLWLSAAPPPAGEPVSLLFNLHRAEGALPVPPDWSPDAVDVGPPAGLQFFAVAGGGMVPLTARDGTGGLRRSGIVRLPLSPAWQPDPAAGARPGLSPYSIVVRTAAASFSEPPRLRAVVANAVRARQWRVVSSADLRFDPGRAAALPGAKIVPPLDSGAPMPASVRLDLREKAAGWKRWRPVPDLSAHGPAERVFVVDGATGEVRFGDGRTGRIPVLAAAPDAKGRWRASASEAGDLPAGVRLEGGAPAGAMNLVAETAVEGAGGRNEETPAQARDRLAGALRTVERAVVADDYVKLATGTQGVAIRRAHAAVGFSPLRPCAVSPGAVTVYVVPDASREQDAGAPRVAAPAVDPGALEAVRRKLDAARLAGTELYVCGAAYRRVDLRVDVAAQPASAAALRARISQALRDHLDPLIGGETGDGWPFGDPLRPSGLLRAAQAALGQDGDVQRVSIGLDGAPPQESCADVRIGAHQLVAVGQVDVRFSPPTTSRGGLR